MTTGSVLTDLPLLQKDFSPLTRDKAAKDDFHTVQSVHRPQIGYLTSKIVAEQAAWDISRQPNCPFKLSVICPTWIFGPCVLPLTKGPESLSISNKLIWEAATANGAPHRPVDYTDEVDVRDVAKAHLLALTNEKAAGERFITTAEYFTYAQVCCRSARWWKPITDIIFPMTASRSYQEEVPSTQDGVWSFSGCEFSSLLRWLCSRI